MITTDTVIVIMDKDGGVPREYPAVVTWVLPDGLAFVKPGYLDPYGATSPQFHRIRGKVSCVGVLGCVAVVENEALTAYSWPPTENTESSVYKAFASYEEMLAEQGRDRQTEARKLQEALAKDLA